MSSEKWLLRLLICIVCILCILAGTVYTLDPYLQYRITDDSYYLHYRFVVPGIIKNADYDCVIIGSSMTQNFRMDDFREKLNVEPIKATVSGTTFTDLNTLTTMVQQAGKASHYYICLDYSTFSSVPDPEEAILPSYLTDNSLWNDYRYWFGYETWMRFVPLDLAFLGLDAAGVDLLSRYQNRMRIDQLEEWGGDFSFGEEIAMSAYNPDDPYWELDTGTLPDLLRQNFLDYAATLDLSAGNYTFFFPPYSACYFHGTDRYGYMDIYMDFKKFVTGYFDSCDNVRVFDFQSAEFTADMSNYKDITHYTPEINSWMVDCFATGAYQVSSETIEESILAVHQNLQTFRQRYAQVLYPTP